MRIGARVGYRGMVREITAHVVRGLGCGRVALCATGGYAAWALADSGMRFRIDPNLTLRGLVRIFDLNRPAPA
jgi:pantothenate kinase type III